ncbi:ferredoxin [Curtobacterium sp. TC1]|jgi:ferredoxin|uniref:ferredoxin n=1 Tax=Curtobacterium sp. TC1 TaxID=2862880 RepID=UPI001C9AEBFA|nr:ferredoxin [Curtobacterium sp. TC1]QZQ56226.1 ferredoxin [Curtobacterium sp. TC1]
MKVILEQDKCVASGQCVMAAMDVFDQRDEDGIAVLLTDEVTDDQVEAVRHAAAVCPALAIRLAD